MTTIYPIKVLKMSLSAARRRISFVDSGTMGDFVIHGCIQRWSLSVIHCFHAVSDFSSCLWATGPCCHGFARSEYV